MKRRRGEKGGVQIYKPPGGQTWWIRYTKDGRQHRRNTGHVEEGQARIFAATVERMLGFAQNGSLDEKQRLLEIAEELIGEIRELKGKTVQLGKDRNVPTVREWFTRISDEQKDGTNGDDRRLKESTIERIRNVHDKWLRYLEGLHVNLADAPLNRIGPDEVMGYLAQKRAEGFSGGTRRFDLARIRAVFGRAVDRGLIATNPASVRQVGRLKFDDKSIRRPFNPRQVEVIFKATEASPHPWLKLSALLGLYTGQRAGDICAMRWEDVRNLESPLPTITVTQQKTGSVVVIPIAEPLRQALQAIPEPQRRGNLLGEVGQAYVQGRRRRFISAWRALLEDVELSTLLDAPVVAKVERTGASGRARYAWTFHSWRHTTATSLNGPEAHYLLGHRSDDEKRLGTTLQYRHEDLQRLKAQLDAISPSPVGKVIHMALSA